METKTLVDQAALSPAQRVRARNFASRLVGQRELGVVLALALLGLFGTFGTDGFASGENLLNVGQQASLIGIMAVGATFVLVSGELDLSVGSIYVLATMITGMLLQSSVHWLPAVAVGIMVGCVCGAINGVLTVAVKLPSFIVTLGTLSVFRGIALLLTNAAPISLDATLVNVDEFAYLGTGRPLGIPMQFIFFIIAVIIGAFVLRMTKFGFHVYAVGGSNEAARLCGIPAARVKVIAFVIQGGLAAFAGILGLAFLQYAQGTTGSGLELLVITAVIIGGTALFGGSGTMLGTLVGVLLIATLQNVLILAGVSSFWQTVMIGVVIIASVALDYWVRGRQRT